MGDDDWRSAERYADLARGPAPALAWEFLRRNPDYRADFEQLRQDAPSGWADADGVRAARWGLSFRRRSQPWRAPAAGVLAA